jgi:hypothetical protein
MRVADGVWCVVLAVAAVCGSAAGQQTASTPATSVAAVLKGLAGRAGVVFVGQVEKIRPSEGVVEITFAVQRPVLGVTGSTYVMREWAGRWTGGQRRFVVGQRAMFFLHTPNAAGLSSPVEGMTGAVPVIPMGADAQALVDVRWLATRVMRPVGSELASAETGAITLADAAAVVTAGTAAPDPVRLPLPVGVAPRPVQYPVGGGPVLAPVTGPVVDQPGEIVVKRGTPVAAEGINARY